MTATVTVHGARADDFRHVFGTTTVPVQEWVPHFAYLPGFHEPQPVFLLDLDWVQTEGHRDALVAFISDRFDQSREFVEDNLERYGMPILASDCTITTDSLLA